MPRKNSIGFRRWEKLGFSMKKMKISKNLEKIEKASREALLLYELSEREPG